MKVRHATRSSFKAVRICSGPHRNQVRHFAISLPAGKESITSSSAGTSDLANRISLLERYNGAKENWYPRVPLAPISCPAPRLRTIRHIAEGLQPGTGNDDDIFSIHGRVQTVRVASKNLVFFVLEHRQQLLQVVCDFGKLPQDEESLSARDAFRKTIRRGDWCSVIGFPYKSDRGEPSLKSRAIPRISSPSLNHIPTNLENVEVRARKPHVGMLVDPREMQTIRMRSEIESFLGRYLAELGFLKVNTPILTFNATGAVAKPFTTVASDISSTKLNLRIAPELWLKRLILGGADRVFELGPAFRNEGEEPDRFLLRVVLAVDAVTGIDHSHNPEFTMCEFYMTMASLEDLIRSTETLLQELYLYVAEHSREHVSHLPDSVLHHPDPTKSLFQRPLPRLAFIPTVEEKMGRPLPDLSDPARSQEALLRLFSDLDLALPSLRTTPHLLDALSTHFLEPLCETPTLITHHPAALSPLAKAYPCPKTGHLVSARAELFIRGREYANMYEEENSPFEQRHKFEEQLAYRRQADPDAESDIDESYLEALEWGLPPTGGFGMGVDRLVMLFTGRKRIGDVLPFGTLRNVVGLRDRYGK